MAISKSKYQAKRNNQMYGPVPTVPKYPQFKSTYVDPRYYYWGELRPEFKYEDDTGLLS